MEDKDRLEGFGQHGERLRVESEVFGHAPGHASDRPPGRVCIPGRVYASVCIRGCIHARSSFRLVSSVPGRPPRVYALYASFPYRGFGKRKETPYIDAYNAYKIKELYFFLYL